MKRGVGRGGEESAAASNAIRGLGLGKGWEKTLFGFPKKGDFFGSGDKVIG